MKKWLSRGSENSVECLNCGSNITMSAFFDHHPTKCSYCQEKFVFLFFDEMVQIWPKHAPFELKQFILWSQKELDEIEFVNLLLDLKDIIPRGD